jgi:glycosyltransferase involved in cell wall biosynthesis
VRGRRPESDRLEERLESLEAAVRRLGARLEDVQGLAARSYEAGLGWPARLAAVRAQPNYEAAWQEAEPLVTVRIATYNNAEVLCERTLASLRAQTYERWEAIVVGDAVTDDTAGRVQALGDPRISFVNLPHRGPYPADDERRWLVAGTYPANHAMREARGAWIAPLDHDDEFEPDHIEVLLHEARQTHAEVVYGQLRVRHAQTGELLPNVVGEWPPAYSQFGFQGAVYHAGLRVFEYDVNAYLAGEPGDWNLARRMWEAGVRFAFLDRIVTTYYWVPRDEQGREWLAWARDQANR